MQNKKINIKNEIAMAIEPAGKKILFACVPADGHFNPLSGLAKHLQSIGYDVRWYCSIAYESKCRKLEIPFFPFKKAFEVTGSNVDEIFPERKKIKGKIRKINFDVINFFTLRGPEYFEDIKEIYASFPFDLLVSDCAFTGIPFVKEKLRVPVVSVGVLPLYETSKDLPPSGLGMFPSYSIIGKIKQVFLRYFMNKIMFKTANRVMIKTLDDHGISNNNSGVFDVMVRKSDLLLQSGTPSFEYYRSDLGRNIRFIGSLVPYKNAGQKDQWFDKRLNRYERVVLVTQGTVEKDIEKIIVPTLEAFKNTDTLVVATTGGSQTQELRKRFPQENYIIEDFIPFEDIMPYADVYISNGGYGGVMLAIENRLPLVVAGVHEGKNEINARIGYFELGINLNTETPKPATIRGAVETVLIDEMYKQNIVRLAEEFAAYDPNDLAAQHIKELLQDNTPGKKFSKQSIAFNKYHLSTQSKIMKQFFLSMIALVLLTTSCKKDHSSENGPVPAPNPVPNPNPDPLPVDDTAKVLLKDIIKSNLPSPYYHFDYTNRYATQVSFASSLDIYSLQYENKRIKKMLNTRNFNEMAYTYTNGRVSLITEHSGISGNKRWEYFFEYNNGGQLKQVIWVRYEDNGIDNSIYRKALLSYHADGNLAAIENFRADANNQLLWSNTVQYKDYDSKVNVDDFGLLKEFFETLLYLPAVKLQKNNPATQIITGTQNDFKVTYTYQYNGNLPTRQTGTMIQTRGAGNGQPVILTTQYSYY